jgi:putative hydroxymethylpyrimidine transport system ATP-binding protein
VVTLPTITITNATLAYGEQTVFAHINLKLAAGKWVGLLGPSGVGKSSLLRMLAGLTSQNEITQGRVSCDNALPLSQQIAYMAQTDLLLPWLSVLDNAVLGCKLRAHSALMYQTAIDQAIVLLKQVGLSHAHDLYPQQLSGGMRQRVALVRTLMEDKPIVLMDEPFSALDAITRYKLQALAADLLRHKTVLFITHDPGEALRLADDVYIMQGNPASLKLAAQLSSPTPRDTIEPDVIRLQALLLHELTQAAGHAT